MPPKLKREKMTIAVQKDRLIKDVVKDDAFYCDANLDHEEIIRRSTTRREQQDATTNITTDFACH